MKKKYFDQIDSLRALAVVMTLLVHWLPESGGFSRIPYMHFGVDLFFVISGFLITLILLKTKESDLSLNKFVAVKNFIVRRTLRLFPIYYLFLLFFCLLSLTGFWLWEKGYGVYYFTYTANFLFYFNNLQSRCFNHLWSLCVEEQFYLLWPWLVLFLPRNIFNKIIYIYIIIGLSCYLFFFTPLIRMLPFSNFHTLGIGALLGYFWFYLNNNNYFNYFKKNAKTYFVVTLFFLLVILISIDKNLFPLELRNFSYFLREIFLSVTLFFFLLSTIIGWNGLIGKIFDNSRIQYIGKISYGIYLYHKPIPFFVSLFFDKMKMMPHPLVLIGIYLLLTFFIAYFSYKFIETPFLKLKEKFN